ncbi:sensor histidine kinase [Paenibacillus sp. PSB04]|uniref:cache domain-containing sensor histidine kinase n=1 Tax=Paenibacillus sp. PSB04 TaxID=2866810 RepID=UPI0021F0B666|nr:sensor histidine kinase [Paenibacillus sp. PSB04]UYO02687.1 sensor histidine kinase [Paenibacillus sp. PSB04]
MLKTKMFIAFSAVSLFIVTLTCLMFDYKNVSDIKSQTFALSDTITRQFSRTFELYVQDIEKLSVSIIGDSIIQNSLIDHYHSDDPVEQNEIELTINNRLFTHLQSRSQLQSIYLFTLDHNAYFVSKASGPKVSFHLEDEIWYPRTAEIMTNKFILLPVCEENTGGDRREKVISFVRNINRIPYRDTLAYMKININVNVINDMLVMSDANEFERSMRVLIVTDQGDIVYDDKDELTGNTHSGLGKSAFQKSPHSGELTWMGQRYLYTIEHSDYTKWNTVILTPKDFLLSKQKKSQYILALAGLLATVLIAFVSYLLSHQITIPLRNLMKKMTRVEQGDFSQYMSVTGNHEISRLSRIYNNMLDSISRLINEVYESKLAEKNAQLSALQAQINPHFLYNTLNIMKSISRVRGIEEVAEMSESLAELFQYSMKNLQHPVPLQEELNHIENYMNIQHHRFGSRFELHVSVPEHLLHASVLKLTIQPLIENAIIHGLGNMKSGGRIDLRAMQNGSSFVIEVSDNGQGMDKEQLEGLRSALQHAAQSSRRIQDQPYGIGLSNIRERIRLFYGAEYGMELESSQGGGTIVRITLPFRDHDSWNKEEGSDEYIFGGG